jgi:hypothetical protein
VHTWYSNFPGCNKTRLQELWWLSPQGDILWGQPVAWPHTSLSAGPIVWTCFSLLGLFPAPSAQLALIRNPLSLFSWPGLSLIIFLRFWLQINQEKESTGKDNKHGKLLGFQNCLTSPEPCPGPVPTTSFLVWLWVAHWRDPEVTLRLFSKLRFMRFPCWEQFLRDMVSCQKNWAILLATCSS